MIGDLVAVRDKLLGHLWIVVNPVARQEEGNVQSALAQNVQNLRSGAATFVAGIKRQRDDAGRRVAVDDLRVVLLRVRRAEEYGRCQEQRSDHWLCRFLSV